MSGFVTTSNFSVVELAFSAPGNRALDVLTSLVVEAGLIVSPGSIPRDVEFNIGGFIVTVIGVTVRVGAVAFWVRCASSVLLLGELVGREEFVASFNFWFL